MDALLVTPSSKADLQLLTALFKKMKIKAQVLPGAGNGMAAPLPKPLSQEAANKLLPRTQAERNLVEAIEEMKEVIAGRKQAISLTQFLDELK